MLKKTSCSLLFIFLVFFSSLNGAIITSNAVVGTWAAGTSWVGGVAPLATDDAIIVGGATITCGAAASITNLTIQNNGRLTATAALTVNALGTFNINAGGFYTHNYNSAQASTTIFNGTEVFNATSTITISSWRGPLISVASSCTVPLVTNVGSNFGNLILNWNTGASLWNNNGLGVGTNLINGNFTVQNTCGIFLNNVAGNVTINIGGNFSILSNGYVEGKRNSTGNLTFNVTGATTIATGINSIFFGIIGNNTAAPGNLIYTTASYTQSNGLFNGTCFANTFGSAGGSVTFTTTGAFAISGGQHVGVNNGLLGNWGVATYNMQSFSLTGGSVIFHETVITDGRAVTINVTNNFTCAFSNATDFLEINGLIGGSQNQVYNITVGGDFTISGAFASLFKTTQDGTGNQNISVGGNLSISGSSTDGFADINICTLNMTVAGDVTITGCTIIFSNVISSHLDLILGIANVNWNQTVGTVTLCNTRVKSGKTVSLSGNQMGAIISLHTILVETGGKLYCANATVGGAGLFTLQTGSTIGVGSIAGITSAGATGNVQVTGARSYNTGATYEYYQGLTPQITGNFTTTTTSGTYPCQVANLVINKTLATNIVTLTNTMDVISPGVLTLTMGVLTTSATAATAPWIRIPSGSSVSPVGGSANSWVDGYIRKQGNTSFIFPTGDGAKWRRIEMTAPSISTEFEARYVDAAYANTSTMAIAPVTVLNHVSLIEHWFLSKPLGVDAATAKVKLYWEDASASGILKFDSLVVGRWSGTGWENASCYTSCPLNFTSSQPERTYTGVASGTGAGTIQSNAVSNFSPFTLASIGGFNQNPLPVELLTFEGHYVDFVDVLNWTTASETNNDYFTVERTFDGINYEEVKRVNGAPTGNSTQPLNYSITDDKQYAGTAYYRLKQTDFNGQFEYSSIISITHQNEDHVSVLPNPVSGNEMTLDFNCDSEGECQIDVLDITGKVIISKNYASNKGSNMVQLNVEQLSSGIYFITIRNSYQMNKIKFIKQ